MRLSHILATVAVALSSCAIADELSTINPAEGGLAALATPSQSGGATTMLAGSPATIVGRARAMGQRAIDSATDVAEYALNFLGIQYKFGGNSPERGFDCSGLVRYVFQQVTGIALPHNAAAQSKHGTQVSMEDLRPGDLVFFNTRRFAFSHVGIYLGDNKFVHAPKKGEPVQIVDINNPYWKKAFDGARRLMESAPDLLIPKALAAGNLPVVITEKNEVATDSVPAMSTRAATETPLP